MGRLIKKTSIAGLWDIYKQSILVIARNRLPFPHQSYSPIICTYMWPHSYKHSERCTKNGCEKGAVRKGLCIAHGEGNRCTHVGCETAAKSNGLCFEHGGGKKCTHDSGCVKQVQRQGLCFAHGGANKKVIEAKVKRQRQWREIKARLAQE